MNLQEKILYCRKRARLSQEALADQIGVSRQAVSKWETGDSSPEISKLLLLANCFDVSTDWLLSEEGPPSEAAAPGRPDASAASDWVESLPGMIGRLIHQYGWLAGGYIAGSGAMLAGMGALSLFILGRMFSSMGPTSEVIFPGPSGLPESGFPGSPFPDLLANNPVALMAKAFIVFGLFLMIAGIAFGMILKQRSRSVPNTAMDR